MIEDLILIGADLEIIELINEMEKFNLIGIIDKKIIGSFFNFEILGSDEDVYYIYEKHKNAKIVITLDDTKIKENLYFRYKEVGFKFTSIISKDSYISPNSKNNEGVIIQRGCHIGPSVSIGICTKINVNSNIMHDGEISDFCTIAPNVVTLGYVKIGKNSFLGANSTILPQKIIGYNVTVGAGTVVTKNIQNYVTVIGNPARELYK